MESQPSSAKADGALSSPSEKGGYPLTIMEKDLIDEKFCCHYCKLLLREPMQNMCGHRFCRVCVDEIGSLPSPIHCQSCKDEGVPEEESILVAKEMYDDKAARREMKKLMVKCISPSCVWKGTFNDFITHDENCERKMVPCPNCAVNVSKAKLTHHTSKSCPKRTVPCNYCKEIIVFDTTETHHKTCPMFSIKCEGCNMEICRKEITEHQEKTCRNRLITCPVPSCNGLKLPMKEFATHFAKDALKQEHIAFVLEKVQDLRIQLDALADNNEQAAGTSVMTAAASLSVPEQLITAVAATDDPNGLRERSAGDGAQADYQSEDKQKLKLHEDLMSVLHSEILRCISKGDALSRGMEKEEKRVRDLYTQYETLTAKVAEIERRYTAEQQRRTTNEYGELSCEPNGVFTWQIPSFSAIRHKAHNNQQSTVNSPTFFSHPGGYKMKLTLFPDGKGQEFKGLSLFLEVVSGPFDDLLVWPFIGKVHFMLLDQKTFRRHHIKSHSLNLLQPMYDEAKSVGSDNFIEPDVFEERLDSFIVRDKIYVKVYVEPSKRVTDRFESLDPRRILSSS